MSPTNHFCMDSLANECSTNLPLTVFTQRTFVADFLQEKCDFRGKTAVLGFEPPLGDLGATYEDGLRFTGKRVMKFLLVLIELFSHVTA